MNNPTQLVRHRAVRLALTLASISASVFAQSGPFFTPGNLVVAVSGCGIHGSAAAAACSGVQFGTGVQPTANVTNTVAGGYGDNQGSPLTLFQYTPSGTTSVTFVNSLALPQTASGANFAVSAEYGSSSEGTLQLSAAGQYLTILGYGLPAISFNQAQAAQIALGNMSTVPLYGVQSKSALAQTGSLTNQSTYTPVPRVAALIDANGNVNSSTAVYNVFNLNNPRSMYTLDGSNAWVSGQGSGSDATGGVFYIPLFATTTAPVSITGLDTTANTLSQETRTVQVVKNASTGNNTLYVSTDTKEGSNSARDFVGTLGTPPTTTLFNNSLGPTQLSGFGSTKTGQTTITSANSNGMAPVGSVVNLSPVGFFFASPSVLYVADSGQPKNNSGETSLLGLGGLQKWVNSNSNGSGTWSLKYTLSLGLNLVANATAVPANAHGTTGLYALAGMVNGGSVNLYATNYTIADNDVDYLYGITDTLSNTTSPGTSFTVLETAPADSNFKGVSFAPSIPNGDVEVSTLPSGLLFTSAGTGCAPGTYPAPMTLAWTASNACTLSVSTPQSGPAGVQYVFSQWEDGTSTAAHTVTAPSTTAAYTASFTTQYLLTTNAGSGGGVFADGTYYNAGSNATITATPATGYYFVNFTGATTSTSDPLTYKLTAPATITANFAAQTAPAVTWPAPAAITYGSALSSVQLDATAGVPGTFSYTPAAGTVLSVGNNQTLSVTFTPTSSQYAPATTTTTINVNPASAPASPAALVTTKVLTRTGGNVVAQITITNTGGTDALNVVLTGVRIGSASATPATQSIGTIAAGTSVQALAETVPGTVGASGAASSFTLTGTFTGGTFSSNARITLP